MAVSQKRRTYGAIAPVPKMGNPYVAPGSGGGRYPTAPARSTLGSLSTSLSYLGKPVLGVSGAQQPARVATAPAVGYVPGTDVQRVPGFYNPQNPYDTGRSGEQNPELARAAGLTQFEPVPGWNYDLGRPLNANARLNEQGYYELGGYGGGGAGQTAYDSDPILQQIRALGAQGIANARSQHTAGRKKVAIDYGIDAAQGAELGLDQNTIDAALANPFSRRKVLENDATRELQDLEDNLNEANLFYSGTRAARLGDFGTQKAQAEADLANDLRTQLAGLDSALAQAEYEEQLRQLEYMMSVGPSWYGDDGGGSDDGGGYSGGYFVPLLGSDQWSAAYGLPTREADDDAAAQAALEHLLNRPRSLNNRLTMGQQLALLR